MEHAPSPDRYDRMRYRRCGASGLRLPEISLGLWHNFGGGDDFETMRRMVLSGRLMRHIMIWRLISVMSPCV